MEYIMSIKKSNVESLVSSEYDLAEDFENVKDKAGDTIEAITDTAQHAKTNVQKYARDSWDDIREESIETQDSIVTFISEYPLASIGAAFLTGVLFSKIFSR
jgi:ElaB/YqjD/DUF883 family membrane-anchored ribosome-binding protein